MRRISTDYSNRLPDDFVAIVLTKEETRLFIQSLDRAAEVNLALQLKKLTEGDKWSES